MVQASVITLTVLKKAGGKELLGEGTPFISVGIGEV